MRAAVYVSCGCIDLVVICTVDHLMHIPGGPHMRLQQLACPHDRYMNCRCSDSRYLAMLMYKVVASRYVGPVAGRSLAKTDQFGELGWFPWRIMNQDRDG